MQGLLVHSSFCLIRPCRNISYAHFFCFVCIMLCLFAFVCISLQSWFCNFEHSQVSLVHALVASWGLFAMRSELALILHWNGPYQSPCPSSSSTSACSSFSSSPPPASPAASDSSFSVPPLSSRFEQRECKPAEAKENEQDTAYDPATHLVPRADLYMPFPSPSYGRFELKSKSFASFFPVTFGYFIYDTLAMLRDGHERHTHPHTPARTPTYLPPSTLPSSPPTHTNACAHRDDERRLCSPPLRFKRRSAGICLLRKASSPPFLPFPSFC